MVDLGHNRNGRLRVLELKTGAVRLERHARGSEFGPSSVRWSRNGAWLLWQNGNELRAWKVGTSEDEVVEIVLPDGLRTFDLIDHG